MIRFSRECIKVRTPIGSYHNTLLVIQTHIKDDGLQVESGRRYWSSWSSSNLYRINLVVLRVYITSAKTSL